MRLLFLNTRGSIPIKASAIAFAVFNAHTYTFYELLLLPSRMHAVWQFTTLAQAMRERERLFSAPMRVCCKLHGSAHLMKVNVIYGRSLPLRSLFNVLRRTLNSHSSQLHCLSSLSFYKTRAAFQEQLKALLNRLIKVAVS
jgi:hypothetical protein